MRIVTFVICFMALILLNGCANTPAQPLSVPGLEKSSVVTIEDNRPSKKMSSVI